MKRARQVTRHCGNRIGNNAAHKTRPKTEKRAQDATQDTSRTRLKVRTERDSMKTMSMKTSMETKHKRRPARFRRNQAAGFFDLASAGTIRATCPVRTLSARIVKGTVALAGRGWQYPAKQPRKNDRQNEEDEVATENSDDLIVNGKPFDCECTCGRLIRVRKSDLRLFEGDAGIGTLSTERLHERHTRDEGAEK